MSDPARGMFSGALRAVMVGGLALLLGAGLFPRPAAAQGGGQARMSQQEMMEMLVRMAPYRGYLEAHRSVRNPPELLGGPLEVSITQDAGGVFVGLPDQRELDENVFGTPMMPRAFAGTPGINGLPPMGRTKQGEEWGRSKQMTPFGDKNVTMRGANLQVRLTDATAMDGAESSDEVQFRASWEDEEGNTYEVRCCGMLATAGVEYPTFGGVVTNHLLHGSTRIGSALMPTEYVHAAFWGMGAVLKNGEVQEQPRLVHGMLTEYVRTDGYELAQDEEVTPTRRHFHLMVPPMMPVMEEHRFQHSDVPTGFTLPNGQELPFWHVMFENVDVSAERGR